MKGLRLVIAALAVFGLAAAANHWQGKSWNELESDPTLTVNWPNVYLNGVPVPVFNVCFSNDSVQTITPYAFCSSTRTETLDCYRVGAGEETKQVCELLAPGAKPKGATVSRQICDSVSSQILSAPLVQKVENCEFGRDVEDTCVKYPNGVYTVPASFEVPITENCRPNSEQCYLPSGGYKTFTIPACNQ